jgi:two-component system response regulator HydG
MSLLAQWPLFEGAQSAFGLVGDSPEIHRVLRFIRKLKNNRSPVLLLGESGTGKELVARALHAVSPGKGAFVAVNSAALLPTLVESELFGHTRGAFTGAVAARRGLIEQAHGGTLFLDEIGEFPLEMQAKLLRALEEKEIRPVGAGHSIPAVIRLIAATNRDLARDVEQGRFRGDLFYRVNVISIRLPPLRDRRQDIPLLVSHFLAAYAPRPMSFTEATLECFQQYDWPGNVRELENCVLRMVALASGSEVDLGDLPTALRNAMEASAAMPPRQTTPSPAVMPLADVEREKILHAMQLYRGDCRKVCRELGIGKTTLYRKLKQYGRPAARSASA